MNELSDRQSRIVNQMQMLQSTAPWILRVTDKRKGYTGVVLEVCERRLTEKSTQTSRSTSRLKDYGRIYNSSLRTCIGAIRQIMLPMADEYGRPLEISQLLAGRIAYRGNIPLDETIGAKLALLFKLHPRIKDNDRMELLAWRIERFTREETMYWLGKVSFSANGPRSVEWAKSGLRLMLAGQHKDKKEVQRLLEQYRK